MCSSLQNRASYLLHYTRSVAGFVAGQGENRYRSATETLEKPPISAFSTIHTKWHRSFFYFVGDWASPGPNALSPTFESPFARLEYTHLGRFNLAYMRHTGKWWQVYEGLTLNKAIEAVRDEGIFHPPG
jgi:hypothetical protein